MRFLLDAGACHSLLPMPSSRTRQSLSTSPDVPFGTANVSVIPIYGFETLKLSLGSSKYHWKFLVADVTLQILGADFLSQFYLLVNVAHRGCFNSEFYSLKPLQRSPSDLALLCPPPHVIPRSLPSRSSSNPHSIYRHIKMMVPPMFAGFRRLALDRLATGKQTFT
ncbi:uncharacterized protein [Palaemon carinicauda]|uniref:uncharacterized protein n=1 Tax=Palaemon carinicauda TaxID=392227 RepID=UPI0035B5819F